jgi:colicin import membrane protein
MEGFSMNKEIQDRIFAAAEMLYEKKDRVSFPTVDAVRKAAKVNMNDASAGMKAWRSEHTDQKNNSKDVPEMIKQIGKKAINSLWRESEKLATEALRAAQAGWDAERAELESMRFEISEAYDVQTGELNELKANHTRLQKALRNAEDKLRDAKSDAKRRVQLAEQKASGFENRTIELRGEQDLAKNEIARLREERDKALNQNSKANEEVATLRGRIEAFETMLADAQKQGGKN